MNLHDDPKIVIYFCECALDGFMLLDIERMISGKFGVDVNRRNLSKLKLKAEYILKAPSNFRYWFRDAGALRVNLEKYKEDNKDV